MPAIPEERAGRGDRRVEAFASIAREVARAELACQVFRGGHRVGGVGLAAAAAGLPVGSDHLDDLDPLAGEVAGQPGAVATGALYPDLDQPAVAP